MATDMVQRIRCGQQKSVLAKMFHISRDGHRRCGAMSWWERCPIFASGSAGLDLSEDEVQRLEAAYSARRASEV
jgi:hypothetical protein